MPEVISNKPPPHIVTVHNPMKRATVVSWTHLGKPQRMKIFPKGCAVIHVDCDAADVLVSIGHVECQVLPPDLGALVVEQLRNNPHVACGESAWV